VQFPKLLASSRTRRLTVAAASAVAFTVALPAAPAQAATSHAYDGADEAKVADPDTRVAVGDFECDGNGVWIDYQVEGSSQLFDLWDSNGCNNGYTTGPAQGPNQWANYVRRFRVCENRVACSNWVAT
jgi:hypothetical protein